MLLDKYFPDKYWALAIPAYGASLTYSFSFIFLGWIFILSYKKNNAQKDDDDDDSEEKDSFHPKNEQYFQWEYEIQKFKIYYILPFNYYSIK